jgi:hypothetical protein
MRKNKTPKLLPLADRAAQKVLRQVTDAVSSPEPRESPINPSSLRGGSMECFLCGGQVEIKISKKNRPYFHCLDCYLQCFIRGDKGIRRLAKLLQGDHDEDAAAAAVLPNFLQPPRFDSRAAEKDESH